MLRLVTGMVEADNAIALPGNHDAKLVRKLKGRDVQITRGLAETLTQLEGETDELGLPVRLQWAADYRGSSAVVYGHTSVGESE